MFTCKSSLKDVFAKQLCSLITHHTVIKLTKPGVKLDIKTGFI